MPNQLFLILKYRISKNSLLSIILGGFLAINHQTIAQGKVIKTQILPTNQRQSKTTNFSPNSNTKKNALLITENTSFPRSLEALPPSTLRPSIRQQEPIFNPIEVNPFPNLRYVVYIESDSALLLGIIRRKIEPRAVLRSFAGSTVIQVGSFSQLFFALDLLDYLEERGINAQLEKLDSNEAFGEPVKPAILAASVYPPVKRSIAYGLSNSKSYYLLIPSKSTNLALITYKLRLLGIPDQGIQVTEIPENVAIGPFEKEEIAEKWQRYLLDSGFVNVVIYFGR
ncbi:MAG: hypothetical protein F6K25_09115 [Okeania sp. SIO2G4]|uniref:hypothetical protein n=1 Tax=unclassified Okeania TaxID=2634635 RepID=UPI0013BD67E5|nr:MULTISPECIES: hypothetical protein [unclassified Okeania]NEP04527.1 hypothetical protein [Okeania sp. SIO4D6]NEP45680.1 hypothetical protein [Okeania sp. SIO2H7]NEP71195.1 hypothetical protein [Okeania sp. SIO2G5]NEP92108.1 hypothetical protein [Okeania sp. SIO2F5]NEQ90864.1 hypothetical protein [Okeania sp. SIO2G4]